VSALSVRCPIRIDAAGSRDLGFKDWILRSRVALSDVFLSGANIFGGLQSCEQMISLAPMLRRLVLLPHRCLGLYIDQPLSFALSDLTVAVSLLGLKIQKI